MRNFLKLFEMGSIKNPLVRFTDWLVRKRGERYIPIPVSTEPIPVPPDRAKRARQRAWYNSWRRSGMRTGGPALTGTRALRVAEACHPRHLLVLPRYLRVSK